jgi:P27 family predicted phage terminase small subunit
VTESRGVKRGSKPKPILVDDLNLIPSAPSAPKILKSAGRELWSSLWIGGRRWLDVSSDVALIEMICRNFDTLIEVNEVIRTHGRYYSTPQGHHLPHPAVADSRNLSAQIVSWLSLAGFSASDRARLQIPMVTVNPLSAWRDRQLGKAALNLDDRSRHGGDLK